MRMQYDDFVREVKNRAKLGSEGEAVRAIRATLETLSERLAGGEPKDLASQLPRQLGDYLMVSPDAGCGEPFTLQEFFRRVSAREALDLPDSVFHARCVMEVLKEALSPGEWADMCAQMPTDYAPLFEPGSTGNLKDQTKTKQTEADLRKAA